MFERTVFLLLQGEFICQVSHPDEFGFLENEASFEEVSRYLARLDRKIARTPHSAGFYLAFSHVGESERDAIKAHFQDFKGTIGPVVLFFQMVMRATGREDLLMPGAILESNVIMSKIDQDPGLRNELQNVALVSRATGADGAYRTMFDKLLTRLRTGGYLTVANSERGLYQVTSKLEYVLDVVRFLQENDPALSKSAESEIDEETAATERPLL
jgi:hypothetical protein